MSISLITSFVGTALNLQDAAKQRAIAAKAARSQTWTGLGVASTAQLNEVMTHVKATGCRLIAVAGECVLSFYPGGLYPDGR